MTADLVSLNGTRLREAFARLIPKGTAVAHIDFTPGPNASNHVAWLGENRLLEEHGAAIVYRCSAQSYDKREMTEKLGRGVIVVSGAAHAGRNAVHRGFRWRVLADFPQNPVIVMPHQPVREDEETLIAAAPMLKSRADLTLFAASKSARQSLLRHLGPSAPVHLAPDTAFLLPPRKRIAEIAYDMVWIARTDGDKANDQTESAARLSSQAAEKFAIPEFGDGVDIGYVAKHRPQTVLLTDWHAFVYENELARLALQRLDFDSWARVYADRAFYIVSLGQVLITDRLHAYILAMLLDIPSILLNDGTGRNWAFHEAWTKSNPRCYLARNPQEAWSFARQAAARLKEMTPAEAAAWTWNDMPANPA